MHTSLRRVLHVAGGLTLGLTLWAVWTLSLRVRTERVPSETVDRLDGVELRHYPRTVLAETTASDERIAFGRLYRYITGENEDGDSLPMTAPVRTAGGRTRRSRRAHAGSEGGRAIPMTAPVRSVAAGDTVTMAFYVPAAYGPDSAPTPTDPAVRLVVEPPKTLAVSRFSWFATARRVRRQRDRLLETLESRGLDAVGDPVLLRYDPPWAAPFLRRNEVAVATGGAF